MPSLNNTSILELDTLPPHLIVVGGSYIGLEFAQMYRRFGSAVTVIERSARLVNREDEEISAAVESILTNEGITIRTGADCIHPRENVARTSWRESTAWRGDHGSSRLTPAPGRSGRRPNTDDLGLDRAGIKVDDHGYIEVDDELKTTVPGIWALGDCQRQGRFHTHGLQRLSRSSPENLLDGGKEARDRPASCVMPCSSIHRWAAWEWTEHGKLARAGAKSA